MRGAESLAGIAVEILVEEQVVTEMRVMLELRALAEDRPLAVGLPRKEPDDAARQLIRDPGDRDVTPRSGRAFDLEIVAVIAMETAERGDDEEIERQPDRAAPVRVAAELARRRLSRAVGNDAAIGVERQLVG